MSERPPGGAERDGNVDGADAGGRPTLRDVDGGEIPAPRPAPGDVIAPAHAAGLGALEQVVTDLGALQELSSPALRVLVSGWLAGFRSARTRLAYAADLLAWDLWCTRGGLEVLAARRVQVDVYLAGMLAAGVAPATASRRLSALSSFYRFLADDAGTQQIRANPVASVRRPAFDRHHSDSVGLDRDQSRALLDAVDRARGPQHLRNAALLRLLLYNALRVDELLSAEVAGLGRRSGRENTHDTLEIRRKGGHRARVALATTTSQVLERYLAERATNQGTDRQALVGPLLATNHGRALTPKAVWELVRRTARVAGIEQWRRLSPHSLRHTAITFALDSGASLRDVQDFAGHRDPRTTRRYDRAREDLDRSPTHALPAWLDDDAGDSG